MLSPAREPGSTRHQTCPACRHGLAIDLLSIRRAPVLVCSVFPDADAARATPGGEIELVACQACGFLYNRVFDLAMALAGAGYESTQSASATFNAFADGLAKDWIARHDLAGKTVIEVGCGQSAFMLALLANGVGHMHGIDPLAAMSDIPADYADRVSIDASDFHARHVDYQAAALVCRHSIEHIPDVAAFMTLCSAWSKANGNAPVLFEAPAAERIVHDGAFWDLFYEHCNYFTVAALATAFEQAGMRVTQRRLEYGEQYIIMDACHDADATVISDAAAQAAWLSACLNFGSRASAAVSACQRRMRDYAAAPGGLVIWQGASKTVGLLTAVGDALPIRCCIDQNTRRHGWFIPPSGLQILPPAALAQMQPAHVVLMNAVYLREVREQLDAMGCTATQLHAIDDVIAA
ncbi:class I SAM-dependent methyltransferase [Nevskia sp.]|uniref:class I SAM-dependent methyltransferase n=1 Tax=Nevskia sp. TaxID=1929292 RepID=UPI0025FCE6F7|nr:class I SAM-dependent methyltransferase [Nevskia sp.]